MGRLFITVKNLSYSYACESAGTRAVLDSLCFDIHAGERLAILGANGSGKSTLLNCLNGLLSPPPSAILVNGTDGAALDPSNEGDLEKIRRLIATVLQNPDDQIISSVAEEDTAFGPENLGLGGTEIRERVDAALKRAGLEKHRKQQVRLLSGGERQRLALAGALALNTEAVVLDEAVSMLDPLGRAGFLALLDELSRAGKTIIQVTHSLEEAFCCGRALVLYQGRAAFDGPPEELLDNPGLETWGFAIPEQIKLFRRLWTGDSPGRPAFTMDAGKAADGIAAALKAVSPNARADFSGTARLPKKEAGGNAPAVSPPAVSFLDASHLYPGVFPGGMSRVSFEASPGQLIALIGQSGSGKSTVLKHINALLLPTEGRVLVFGKDTLDRKTSLSDLRAKAALSVQSPESALFENYVADDVAFGPRNSGLKGKDLARRVKTAMENSGLPFGEFADRRIRSLSGGEKRRAAIAGTAAMESDLLLLDEALTSLDGFNQKKITGLIEDFCRRGKTVIISTHSMETAALADRVGVMVEGKLSAFGSPGEIFGPRWDPAWGLSLPWITEVSRRLSALGVISPEAVPFTSEELWECLSGVSIPVSESESGRPFAEGAMGQVAAGGESAGPASKKSRLKGRRRKTGAEFFHVPSFEELPPGSSPLQNLSGSFKLFLLFFASAAALILPPPYFPLGILAAVTAAGWFAGRIKPGRLFRGFFRILPWLLAVCAIQLALHIDPMRPLSLVLRIAVLSSLFSLFYAVTPLRELVRAFNRLFAFFARFGFPARDFSMAVGIALRFVPILSEEAENIVSAQLSRGGKKGRVRMAVALAAPLTLRALERADALAKAIMLRCYRLEGKLGEKNNRGYSKNRKKNNEDKDT